MATASETVSAIAEEILELTAEEKLRCVIDSVLPPSAKILTEQEMASLLGVPCKTLSDQRRDGGGHCPPHFKLGRSPKYSRTAAILWIMAGGKLPDNKISTALSEEHDGNGLDTGHGRLPR